MLASKDKKIKIISLLRFLLKKKKNTICEEFQVPDYLVRLTTKLMKAQGILPDLFKGVNNTLSENVNAVIEFTKTMRIVGCALERKIYW